MALASLLAVRAVSAPDDSVAAGPTPPSDGGPASMMTTFKKPTHTTPQHSNAFGITTQKAVSVPVSVTQINFFGAHA